MRPVLQKPPGMGSTRAGRGSINVRASPKGTSAVCAQPYVVQPTNGSLFKGRRAVEALPGWSHNPRGVMWALVSTQFFFNVWWATIAVPASVLLCYRRSHSAKGEDAVQAALALPPALPAALCALAELSPARAGPGAGPSAASPSPLAPSRTARTAAPWHSAGWWRCCAPFTPPAAVLTGHASCHIGPVRGWQPAHIASCLHPGFRAG